MLLKPSLWPVLIIALIASTALAEQPRRSNYSANIDTLVKEAIDNSPEFKSLQASFEDANGQVVTASTWENPELSVGPGIKQIPSSEGEAEDRFYRGNYELTQKFMFPGKRALLVAVAKHEVKATQIALDAFHFQMELRVRKNLADLWLLKQKRMLREKQLASAQALLESARKRAQGGYASEFESIKAEAESITTQGLVREAKAAEQQSKIALATLLGKEAGAVPSWYSFDERAFRLVDAGLGDLALENNPALKIQLVRAEKADINVAALRKSRYPDPAIGPFVEYGKDERVYGLGISIPLPLWDLKKGEIASAEAAQSKELAEIERTRKEILLSVQSSLERYRAARSELDLYGSGFQQRLEEAMTQAEQSYLGNATSFLIYIDAKRTYFESMTARLEALERLAEAYFEVQSAVGVPAAEFIGSKK